nr:retrovirus-related Pol polyprotein from transposon TNT 1-94 [Tanacetum cinerariifolium]
MIGALMYLTSNRPDIVHATCLCAGTRLSQPRSTSKSHSHILQPDSTFKNKTDRFELYFVKTDYQLADIFTKALPTDRFNYLVRLLGMRSLSPKELERLAKSQPTNCGFSRSYKAVKVRYNLIHDPVRARGIYPGTLPLDRVEVLGIFRINPYKAFRVHNFVPNKHVKPSVRTKSITVSQPHVINKNDANSKTNGFSPKDVKSTTRNRRPLPGNNPKNDKVPSKSKSSRLSNNLEKIEENHRNLQSSLNKKHMSSECNNIKLAIRNANSEFVCPVCKQCLITVNHDVCVLNYVNGMNSHGKKQKANVCNQKKHKAQVWKPKNVGSKERLALPKPSTPRSCHRWSPTGRLFDLKGKIITTSESECQSNCFKLLTLRIRSANNFQIQLLYDRWSKLV